MMLKSISKVLIRCDRRKAAMRRACGAGSDIGSTVLPHLARSPRAYSRQTRPEKQNSPLWRLGCRSPSARLHGPRPIGAPIGAARSDPNSRGGRAQRQLSRFSLAMRLSADGRASGTVGTDACGRGHPLGHQGGIGVVGCRRWHEARKTLYTRVYYDSSSERFAGCEGETISDNSIQSTCP